MSKTSVIRIGKGHNEKVELRDVEGFGRVNDPQWRLARPKNRGTLFE